MAVFAVMIVVTFFMTPILVKGLGDDRYGIWVFVESIIKYLALFDLGITAAVVKYVAKFNATEDRDEVNRIYSTSIAIFSSLGLLVGLTTIAYALFGVLPRSIDSTLAYEARIMIALLGFNLAVGLPLSVYNSIVSAIELYWMKNIVQILVLIGRSLVFLWVLSVGGGIIAIGITITAFGLIQHLALLVIAHVRVPSLKFSLQYITSGTFHQVRNYSIWSFVAAISSRVSFQTDALVIGICLDPGSVTYFAIAARLIEYSKSFVRSATMVLTPRFSVLDSLGDYAEVRRLLVFGTRVSVWLSCFISQCLILLGPAFIGRWMGVPFQNISSPVLIILALPLPLFLAHSVSARVLYGIGRVRPFATTTAICAILNLGLSLFLVQHWGIAGVAVGTAMPCLVQVLVIACIVCRATELPLWRFFRQAYLAPLCGATVATLIWLGILTFFALESYLSISCGGIIGLGLNLALALLFDRELSQRVRGKVEVLRHQQDH